MSISLIRRPEVQKRTGLSRSTIYLLMEQNKFPQSIKIGDRACAWIDAEIDEWIKNRIAAARSTD